MPACEQPILAGLFQAAKTRSPTKCPTDFQDTFTRVAPSSISDAGRGLFAVSDLLPNFPLYVYSGLVLSEEEADRYPNAYQVGSPSLPGETAEVVDASTELCSPAKYINSKGRILLRNGNNCQLRDHEGHVYLVTDKAIKAGEELFAAYGALEPKWPMTFLGCSAQNKSAFLE